MMNEKDKKSETSPGSIPPPLDPFPTYQTPYPRSNTDDPNPFIQFRRFADEQISSLFNGIPQLFGFASGDAFKNEIENIMKHHQKMEEGWRKQFEQEMEEMKQSFEKERHTTQAEPENPKPWWIRGNAAKCPALNGELQQSNPDKSAILAESRSRPNTELDMYESGQSEKENKCHRFSTAKNSRCGSGGWFSSLGWDGKHLKETDTQPLTGSDGGLSDNEATTRPSKYTMFRARHLDPIENNQHTIPWLVLSSYSPVYLSNPDQPRLFKVHIQDHDGVPFQISRPRFRRHWISTETDEKMAQHLPWADAFEDLISLQQTGKMVERDFSTWKTPTTWIHDMVSRGSFGPRWGFNEEGQLIRSRSENTSAVKSLPEWWIWRENSRPVQHDDKEVKTSAGDWWPTADEVMNVMKQVQEDMSDEKPAIDEIGLDSSAVDPVVETTPKQFPVSEWSSTSSTWNYDNDTEESKSIVSTLTTTKRRTLPDGSIETTREMKKRFSDGTEESNESIEVENVTSKGSKNTTAKNFSAQSSVDKHTQTPVQDEIQKQKRKGGWFWN